MSLRFFYSITKILIKFFHSILFLQCEIDYTREARTAFGRDTEQPSTLRLQSKELSLYKFLHRYSSSIFLASATWMIINIVFIGQLLLIDQPTKIIGFNKGKK